MPHLNPLRVALCLLLLLYAAAACQGSSTAVPGPTQTPAPAGPGGETVMPEEVPTPFGKTAPCAFVWSREPLPEVAEELRKALLDADLPGVDVQANAFGEDCINTETGAVVEFHAMQTDLHLKVPVESTDDTQEMGEWLEKILLVLEQFPPEKIAGPRFGTVGIQFSGKSAETGLSFPLETAQLLLHSGGLRGNALYRALENL